MVEYNIGPEKERIGHAGMYNRRQKRKYVRTEYKTEYRIGLDETSVQETIFQWDRIKYRIGNETEQQRI